MTDRPVLEYVGMLCAVCALAVVAFWFWLVFNLPAHGLPVSCEVIRDRAKGLSEKSIERMIRAHGLSEADRADVWKCIKRDKRCDTPARYEAMREGANCS